tara:strand:- start:272 stop:499 length:228 start_codon:yes stop_codon:yes gene_type:complete
MKEEKPMKSKKNRCAFCNKKTGLIFFTCDCNQIYCSSHRYAHSHNCTHTKEKSDKIKQDIQTNNPKIDHFKIEQL